jgi:hypothetical protein
MPTVQFPPVSAPAQNGAVVSFPDEATAQQHSGTAWKSLQTEDSAELDRLADEHIKATHHLLVRYLKHLYTATGPGGIAAAPTDADGFSRADYKRLAESIEKNGLGAVHDLS